MNREKSEIHPELYRILKNKVTQGFRVHSLEFIDVKSEYPVNGGWADLVVNAKHQGPERAFLTIEVKGGLTDPFRMETINQAAFYAVRIGTPYFSTTNGRKFVIFETFKEGVPLTQRKAFVVETMSLTEDFAERLLHELASLHLGTKNWNVPIETLTARLRSFHEAIYPEFLRSMESRLRSDSEFAGKFSDWAGKQFPVLTPGVRQSIAKQAAYIWMNRLLFDKTLGAYRAVRVRLGFSGRGETNNFRHTTVRQNRISKDIIRRSHGRSPKVCNANVM